MDRGAYVAVSGSMAQERAMDVIANNLANINTGGYKADRVLFETYLQKNMSPGANIRSPQDIKSSSPQPAADSTYIVTSQVYTDFSQGPLRRTDRLFDVALMSDGFIAVETDAGERYWRGGTTQVNQKGELVTPDGYRLLDINKKPVTVGLVKFRITEDGTILNEQNLPITKIRLVDFPDKSTLIKQGSGLYSASDSKKAVQSQASIRQGFTEGSNINPVAEMTRMITALRAYEAFRKSIQSDDEMTARLIGDVAR
ncbi:MAG: flagellar basal body rod protein FlgG [bacterium]|nr:MAG: flagellar basal body rod protein FlgG [bacterium]